VGAVGADVEAVGDLARPERVLPGAERDALVADVDRDRALEDVEALVLGVVDVQRRGSVRRHRDVEQRVLAARVGGARLDLNEAAEEPARLAARGG
jgi:hypothetical protein